MSQNAFAPSFEPIVKVGENVKIIKGGTDKDVIGLFRVKYIEPLPEKKHDFGAIAANTSLENQEVTDLYLSDGEFAQYRLLPLEDMEITVVQPAGKTRFATKAYANKITPLTAQIAPHLNQVFVYEDEAIKFTIKNPTNYQRLMHRILYSGWRYILEKIWAVKDPGPIPQIPATVVVVEGG